MSLDLQKKRLFILSGKDRQELESMKEDFEEEQREIENRMNILQSVSSKVSKIDKYSLVADWIGNVNVFKPITDNQLQIIPTVGQPRDDINFLCQTISDVVDRVAPSGNNELLSRHIVARDFPTFDGNPEDFISDINKFVECANILRMKF
ncbi:hypothetical protein JTB14_032532 [Gonioctena quinquepunctata]|nr:hypothetical protein JTB14_032532 [Gonioctena quinquepunctata]